MRLDYNAYKYQRFIAFIRGVNTKISDYNIVSEAMAYVYEFFVSHAVKSKQTAIERLIKVIILSFRAFNDK